MVQGIDDSEFDHPVYGPVCTMCKHLESLEHRTCAAFPDGIPFEIWDGKNNHTKSYKGDHGILFEPARKDIKE